MTTLAPFLLWLGSVLVYEGWRRSGVELTRLAIQIAGTMLIAIGGVFSVVSATGWGAGLGAAVAHVSAAFTLLAIAVPLSSRPVWVMAAAVCLGGALGWLEGRS